LSQSNTTLGASASKRSTTYPFVAARGEKVTALVALLMLAVGLVWSLWIAPLDAYQGLVTRILFIHVPSAWITFLAFGVVFVCSIQYLRTRLQRYDTIAHAAAMVGLVFTGLCLATGSIWGRFAWGVWWTWDARLTTVAVLFLIYAVYLILRGLIDDESRRARYAAAVGILGFVDVPIIHFSVYWWRTLHQPASLLRPDSPRMAPSIMYPLLFMTVTFIVLFIHLLLARRRMLEAQRLVERNRQEQLHEPV
jgi:heme exporter protein C